MITRLAGSLAAAGRTNDADGLIGAAMAREDAVRHRPARRHRDPALPLAVRRHPDDRVRPAAPRRGLRRPGRPRRPGVPDRRTGLRRTGAHEAAVQPGTGFGPQGLRRIAAQPRPRPTRSSHSSTASSTRRPPAAAAPAAAPPPRRPSRTPRPKSIVAITACPTGIAHTYMAADALAAAAKEPASRSSSRPRAPRAARRCRRRPSPTPTPSSSPPTSGSRTSGRFAGKPVVASGVKRAINEPDKMIAEAVAASDNPNAARVEGSARRRGHAAARRRATSAGAPEPGRSCSPA